jgi:outer membrane protein insertion porin family
MRNHKLNVALGGWAAAAVIVCAAAPASAQALIQAAPPPVASPAPVAQAPAAATITAQPMLCGTPIPPPPNLPPTNIGPVVYYIAPCFDKQGNVPVVEAETYLYYIQLQPSLPSQNIWRPWDQKAEQTALDDTKRLWATNFLDDFSLEVQDYHFENGVIGKLVTYHLEERQRVKNVTYVQAADSKPYDKDGLNRTKFEEKLRELGVTIRLDSFVDSATNARVANSVREMLVDKGYQDAKVEPVVELLEGGPKTVNLTFKIAEGPKVKITDVAFIGNKVFSNGDLKGKMKQNKGGGFFIFKGSGVYQEDKFEEDAQRITDFYRENGYIEVNVGEPTLKKLRDSKDGKERFMTLEIPVHEGRRFKVREFAFDGNTKVTTVALRPLFKLQPGDYYNEKKIHDGLDKSKEIYGSVGYFEMTGLPELVPAGVVPGEAPSVTASRPAVVNVTMKMQEGKQYFINRITFVGNTTTRDNVIRREMRLYENGVFNTEALKFSIRRLNQLGYFKPLEDQKNITVEKTPGSDSKVNLSLKLEEQNRNQLSFGAGVSQYDGVFGQLSFSTANFMGRGESLTLSMQTGARAHDYEIAFTEPFLFDRPITGSVDLHRRDIHYLYQFTQGSTGGNITFGWPLANFTRMYLDYSYDRVKVADLNQAFFDSSCLLTSSCSTLDISNLTTAQLQLIQQNPYLYDSLLIGKGGRRSISKVTPTIALNSVDNPVTPVTGRRYTISSAVSGLGGDTRYVKPSVEGVWFLQQNKRISLGLRAQAEYIRPWGSAVGATNSLPIFEKLVLGGGYSVRGYDLRSIGPRAKTSAGVDTGVVVGGNKSLLFNAEYLINIAGPVRLILFYDAGQVKDTCGLLPIAPATVQAPVITAGSIFTTALPTPVQVSSCRFDVHDFITSTGAEIRFFMPVLNVPFRLIFAANPQRTGVLNSSTLQQEKKYRFRFDVGSTF